MSVMIAEVLLQRRQFREAEEMLRQRLAQAPEDGQAHAMLAIALAFQERFDDALAEAKLGIQFAPNSGYSHQAQALAYRGLKKFHEATQAIQEAIRLEPETAQYYTQLATIRLEEQMWHEALRAAETALQLDPHNINAINIRAQALLQLGQKKEAAAAIMGALARDPNSSSSHANQGWAMLHQSQINQAMVHFREALRLNPNNTYAQNGIIEALKARNPIYRVMLAYFLKMSRLDSQTRWMIVVGAVVLIQIVRGIGRSNSEFAPIAAGISGIYLAFVFLTWSSPILFDLLLRVHRVGRFALPQDRKNASNWVGLCLLVAVGFVIAAFAIGGDSQTPLLWGAAKSAVVIMPVAGVFHADKGKSRWVLLGWTLGLIGVGVLGLLSAVSGGSPGNGWDGLFILGFVAYSWVGAALIARQA